MKRGATRAATTATCCAGLVVVAAAASACGRSSDDSPKPPLQLGFVPPPGTTSTARPAPVDSTVAPPAFTSYFDTLDAGPRRTSAAALAQPTQNRPDPDVASQEALRSRLDTCFPLAHLAIGATRNVAVTFTVIATGRVSRYDISGASSADGAFYDCVHGIAEGAAFPERSTTAVPGGPPPVPDVRTIVVTAGATAS